MSFKYPIPLNKLPKSLAARRRAFLKEAVTFYGEDPDERRSIYVDTVSCRYRYKNNRCAVGRWISDKKYKKSFEGTSVRGFEDKLLNKTSIKIFKSLPQKIQSLGSDFIGEVQALHDDYDNWADNGLSREGVLNVRRIKELFKL
jgi:hypothetical protein